MSSSSSSSSSHSNHDHANANANDPNAVIDDLGVQGVSASFLFHLLRHHTAATEVTEQRIQKEQKQKQIQKRMKQMDKIQKYLQNEETKQIWYIKGIRMDILSLLPIDLSLSIVSFLGLSDVISLCKVSVLHRILSNDENIWRVFAMRHWQNKINKRELMTQLEYLEWKDEETKRKKKRKMNNSNSNEGKDNEEKGEGDEKKGKKNIHNNNNHNSNDDAIMGLDYENVQSSSSSSVDDPSSSSSSSPSPPSPTQTFPSCRFSPVPIPYGWKHRYILSELDSLRTLISLDELVRIRWGFSFRTNFFMREERNFYPKFYADNTVKVEGLGPRMPFTFRENKKPFPRITKRNIEEVNASSSSSPSSIESKLSNIHLSNYERKGFITLRERLLLQGYSMRGEHVVPSVKKGTEGEGEEGEEGKGKGNHEDNHSDNGRRRSENNIFDNQNVLKWSATPSTTSSSSPLSPISNSISLLTSRSPDSFPPSRYPIGFSFVFSSISPLHIRDITHFRTIQVSSYPPLTCTRTKNWGWKMTNPFVIFESMKDRERKVREVRDENDISHIPNFDNDDDHDHENEQGDRDRDDEIEIYDGQVTEDEDNEGMDSSSSSDNDNEEEHPSHNGDAGGINIQIDMRNINPNNPTVRRRRRERPVENDSNSLDPSDPNEFIRRAIHRHIHPSHDDDNSNEENSMSDEEGEGQGEGFGEMESEGNGNVHSVERSIGVNQRNRNSLGNGNRRHLSNPNGPSHSSSSSSSAMDESSDPYPPALIHEDEEGKSITLLPFRTDNGNEVENQFFLYFDERQTGNNNHNNSSGGSRGRIPDDEDEEEDEH